MDFVEKLFGVAPDGGTGALEFALLLVPLVVGCVLLARRCLTRVIRSATS
jgi:hypothetical protein